MMVKQIWILSVMVTLIVRKVILRGFVTNNAKCWVVSSTFFNYYALEDDSSRWSARIICSMTKRVSKLFSFDYFIWTYLVELYYTSLNTECYPIVVVLAADVDVFDGATQLRKGLDEVEESAHRV